MKPDTKARIVLGLILALTAGIGAFHFIGPGWRMEMPPEPTKEQKFCNELRASPAGRDSGPLIAYCNENNIR